MMILNTKYLLQMPMLAVIPKEEKTTKSRK